jgi:hypothetical protein
MMGWACSAGKMMDSHQPPRSATLDKALKMENKFYDGTLRNYFCSAAVGSRAPVDKVTARACRRLEAGMLRRLRRESNQTALPSARFSNALPKSVWHDNRLSRQIHSLQTSSEHQTRGPSGQFQTQAVLPCPSPQKANGRPDPI